MKIIRVTDRLQAPRGLQIATAVLVLGALVLALFAAPDPLLLVLGFGFNAVIVVFLLRGSRAAWVFALVAALLGVVSPFIGGPIWSIGSGLAVATCLLLPGTVGYVWDRERTIVSGTYRSTSLFNAVSNAAMRRLLAPDDFLTWRLVGQLFVLVVALFLLVGAASLWKNGSGSGSAIVTFIYRIVWVAYGICQISLLVALVVVLCLHISRRRAQGLE